MTTTGGNRLPILAGEIRKAHADARAAARTSLAHAMEAGGRLLEAKALLQHGGWLDWLRENCDMSERTAQLYMRLAKNKEVVDAKSATVADLGIRGAIAEITKPLAPESEVDPRDCLPPSGFMAKGVREGKGGRDEIWVVPSFQHPGYFYVTHVWNDADVDKSAIVNGFRRPVVADWVPYMVSRLLPGAVLSWEHDVSAAWTYNIFLFDSPAAYVNSENDLGALADLAHGRPPQ